MAEIQVTREVEAPAAKVWAIIENFGDISWAPGIERVEVIGSGIGMIRRIFMPGMEPIDEQLTEMEPGNMRLAYVIPRGLPMPLSDYGASGRVTALGENRCRLDWRGKANPETGLSEAEAVEILQGTYDMLLEWIASHATA